MDLKGKKANFLGDSITEGVGVAEPDNRYDQVLGRLCGLAAVRNYGISGTRIAHQDFPSQCASFDQDFCSRVAGMDPDADLIVVFGGVNDYGHGGAPFGTETDRTPGTFCGAVNRLMTALKEKWPAAQIVFLAPARCGGAEAPSENEQKQLHPGASFLPLIEYVDVILRAGKRHGIPVLDLYRELNFSGDDMPRRPLYVPDGLHPNDLGHRVIAEKLYLFLQNL